MKNVKIPMRTCIVTKEKYPKKELIRIVKNKEGMVFIDLSGKQNGKGVYLKKDKEVFMKAYKNRVLDKALETNVDDSIYLELNKLI